MGRKADNPAAARELLDELIGAQRHRGPDSSGMAVFEGAALGHARLAILDLSSAGNQPFCSRDGRFTIVFNGEIFNYRELRKELERETAITWRSSTDTEVLVEACACWGIERTLNRLAGMFAFALWDRPRAEMTLVRDRLGEKPLVYFSDGESLVFASELKALEHVHQRVLDPVAVEAYLALGYVPAPLSIFRGCKKLEPGTLARFRNGNLRLPQIESWWKAKEFRAGAQDPGAASPTALRQVLGLAVAQRLHADVAVALSLSGGVDSSIVATECVRQGSRPEAFTVEFAGDMAGNTSDVLHARAVARKLGLQHEVVRANPRQLLENMADLTHHYDEPFADSSAIAALELGRALKGRHKVLLNGDGGDEIFGGYRHYEHIDIKQTLKRAAAAAGWIDGGMGRSNCGAENTPDQVYVQSKTTYTARDRAHLLGEQESGQVFQTLRSTRAFNGPAGSSLERALWLDRHLALANGLNFKTDIALGAAGIEGRAPFLDHRVADWASTLPASALVRGREKKVLLREAYRDLLPAEILNRKKHGFGAPIREWLAGPLKHLVQDLLPCPLLDANAQDRMLGQSMLGQSSAQKLWTLTVFSQWARLWRASW